jgi:hypothetical protein
MTKYALGSGRLEGDNGSRGTLHEVSLDFDRSLQERVRCNNQLALEDGELRITGTAKHIVMDSGALPATCQIYFHTFTSNFGVPKKVTIKLNYCRLTGNTFEAMADASGNVFTLSMEDDQ